MSRPRIAGITILMLGVTAAALAATAGATPGTLPAPMVTTSTTVVVPPQLTTTTAPVVTTTTAPAPAPRVEPVQATPTRPIHDGLPQAAAGETAADAVTITDDGFGNPVETGSAEVRRLGHPYDTADLAELCQSKPWLCDDSYAR